jgi:CheY-like chemotaxis protein
VVDDDASIRDLLRIHLGNAGYEVRLAEDAIVAGHLIVRHPPDLLLLDVDMPYMTGFEFYEALRADSALPKIPVVVVSAHGDAQERAKELGLAFLPKPIFLDQLLREVARHLPGAPTPL